MAQVVVEGGIIQCSHKGQARLTGGDSRLTVSGNGAITSGKEVGISFASGPAVVAPCKFPDPKSGAPSPCTATLVASAGQSTLLAVGGVPVLLDSAIGLATNAGDPTATWSISKAGQTLLSSS